jgi:hypothetical protein
LGVLADKQNFSAVAVDGIGLWKSRPDVSGILLMTKVELLACLSFQYCSLRYRGMKTLFMKPQTLSESDTPGVYI